MHRMTPPPNPPLHIVHALSEFKVAHLLLNYRESIELKKIQFNISLSHKIQNAVSESNPLVSEIKTSHRMNCGQYGG